MEHSYREGLQFSKELTTQKEGNKPDVVPGYTSKQNYEGASNTPASSLIIDSQNRQRFVLSPKTDPLFINSKDSQTNPLQANGWEITQKTTHDVSESLHTCYESGPEIQQTCTKYLVIELEITPAIHTTRRVCGGHRESRAWGTKHVLRHCGGCQNQSYTIPKKVVIKREEWVDTCQNFEKLCDEGLCRYVILQKSPDNETRFIQGEPITRPLFEERRTYACYKPITHKEGCEHLRNQGCLQVSSRCHEKQSNYCLVFAQTYKCKNNTPLTSQTIKQGNAPFCLIGNCHDASYAKNDEFLNAISKLSLMQGMAKTQENLKVFKGTAMECSKNPANFKDCCGTPKGWGLSCSLAGCSPQEKDLASRRSKNLCVKVGTYCAKKVMGTCLSKRTSFCCFPSKLAKVFQEQGHSQLHKNWGSAESPNCEGLSIEDIQRLDFDKMDLSELFQQIQKSVTIPDSSHLQQSIKNKIKNLVTDTPSLKHKETK